MKITRRSHHDYTALHSDKQTGEKIAVEVEPVAQHLLNKTDSLNLEVEQDKTQNYIVLRSRKITKSDKKLKKQKSMNQQGSGRIQWTIV